MSSAPPNRPPNRAPPVGPNGLVLKPRRPKPADPLVRPKKRPIPRPQPRKPDAAPIRGGDIRSVPQLPPKSQTPVAPKPPRIPSADDIAVNGFSGPLISQQYVDFPVVTTKRAMREGLRNHVAKFLSKKNIDPRDEAHFTRPVRLQRRDPRASVEQTSVDKQDINQKGLREGGMTEVDREVLEAKKAARAKEREENLAQIAPSASSGAKRTNAPKQRIQQVFKSEMTPDEIAKARVKYEEALPWHLEDFDNKNTWVGKYEAAMSETYVMFVLENSGKLRMVPIDKWYKFSAKNPFKALTIEEAEKYMAKKIKDPRWFMEKEQARKQEKELADFAKQRRVYTGRVVASGVGEGGEGDDMDFEEDRFADDEEHMVVEEDEETKIAEKRIKKEQLKANVFDLRDEKDYEAEEKQEQREKEALKEFGKKVRKALQRREKNFDYSSGSDGNPWSEEESTDDSEAERLKAEEEKKKEKGDKSSTPIAKGSSTPSDRQKFTDPLKKGPAQQFRKRAGSPNASDASGTDTPRKKAKNKHIAQSLSAQQSKPNSRPMSPAPSTTSSTAAPSAPRKADGSKAAGKKRARTGAGGAGSGSDVEKAVVSGAEMSDSVTAKKLKIDPPTSKRGTPVGSRAGSPVPANGKAGLTGNRPSPPVRSSTPAAAAAGPFPTHAEVHAAIPQSGILSGDLLKLFRPRLGDMKTNYPKFIAIVKEVGVFAKEDKLLRPAPNFKPGS
ncbi:transcription factor IIF subunit tfg1 [Ophidiomyces ophidiicola]|nr:transcription factor IIF subunit tfg1 [Ophidiomyces ophidiicola]KAI1916689.1 transcription factor IIF subunit tfg1 [Ophidiomyces ophidiicola]KAI1928033.1 transcription factor IIF subunit tfg1 [Ophidiomyces ophidiicola]KAI1964304.1 transcription factor IIF subunit tfg1 [Ophidiomyces ophidiicola]KAI1971513.1 transcription factor IIF subunit tfg1 [Ophidiomyces ophidiicola]